MDDTQAKGAINKLSAATKRRLLALLAEHVNQEHRKTPSAKDLIGWIHQPNVVQNYWFYKAAGLKALISARGMTLTSGRKSIEEMREVLAGVNDSLLVTPMEEEITRNDDNEEGSDESFCNAKDEAAKAILQKSFLPH